MFIELRRTSPNFAKFDPHAELKTSTKGYPGENYSNYLIHEIRHYYLAPPSNFPNSELPASLTLRAAASPRRFGLR